MKKETFLEILKLYREHSEARHELYKMGLDVMAYDDRLFKIIELLLKAQFGENIDIINAHLHQDGELGKVIKDDEVLATIVTDEDLWQYLQEEAEREKATKATTTTTQ